MVSVPMTIAEASQSQYDTATASEAALNAQAQISVTPRWPSGTENPLPIYYGSTVRFVPLGTASTQPQSVVDILVQLGLVDASGSFNPHAYGTVGLWLDASQLSGLSDGDPVQPLPDLSGNGRDQAQATLSKRAVYRTGAGLPAVRFDGVDDEYSGAGAFQCAELFLVLRNHTTGIPISLFPGYAFFHGGPAEQNLLAYDGSAQIGAAITATPAALMSVRFAADAYLRYNRALVDSGALSALTVAPVLGQYDNLYYLDADFCEMLIYSSLLSVSNRDSIESYLASKWSTP